MRTIELGKSGLQVPVIAVGCMRLKELDEKAAGDYIRAAVDMGATFFDHADVYGDGLCEDLFARAAGMTPAFREKIILQSKCGIVRGKMFDFSRDHILASVDAILKRLRTEYLDCLLLHRPDALIEPEEVAQAFDKLLGQGKVRHFGVSNQNPMQMQLLQKFVKQPIVANQLQLSLAYLPMISAGTHVNMLEDASVNRDGGALDFCRLHDITIQVWSPFQYGYFGGVFLGSDKYPKLNAKLEELAGKYAVTPTTIAVAWLLRHPARMQTVVGTMKTARLKECVDAAHITLSREEWYALYLAGGNTLP